MIFHSYRSLGAFLKQGVILQLCFLRIRSRGGIIISEVRRVTIFWCICEMESGKKCAFFTINQRIGREF